MLWVHREPGHYSLANCGQGREHGRCAHGLTAHPRRPSAASCGTALCDRSQVAAPCDRRLVITALPTLVELGPISGSEDIDQAVAFGDPFAAGGAAWTEFVSVIYPIPVAVRTPQGSASLSAMIVAAVPLGALGDGGVIAPRLSPVRQARIAGASLDAPAAGVGTSPTVTWQPPEIGTATGYRVAVYALDASPLGSTRPGSRPSTPPLPRCRSPPGC